MTTKKTTPSDRKPLYAVNPEYVLYDYEAVDMMIRLDPTISKNEAKKIHRLLAGWRSSK